ncbi:MAG: CAP domain-containing protein [Spirochaetota bacterium]
MKAHRGELYKTLSQRMNYLKALTIFLFASFLLPVIASNNQYRVLKQLESDLLQELNLLRSNPSKYAQILNQYRSSFRGNSLYFSQQRPLPLKEGVKPLEEAIQKLTGQQPLHRLTLSPGMSLAAKDHALDLLRTGQIKHTGSDRSNPFDRMNRYGKWKIIAGETISVGRKTAREIIVMLLIDDGEPSRNRRANLLKKNYITCGISCVSSPNSSNTCVITYSGGFEEKK